MKVHLIRHTNVDVPPGTCYGQTDVGLADDFEAMAARLIECLPSLDLVFTSPLTRCVQLANLLCDAPEHDARLIEYDFGQWEMTSWSNVPSTHPWFDDFVHVPAPGGESYANMAERVLSSWRALCTLDVDHLGVVTHAGVIRVILADVLNISLEDVFRLSISTGSVTRLSIMSTYVQVEQVNG